MPEAENREQPKAEALQQDQLVEQLMSDPSQGHPDVRPLVGFLGRSTQEGHVRLYLTAALDMYVEIPTDAIVQRQAISSRRISINGTMLWVKADTTIEYCARASIHLRQAAFLGGNITTPPTAGTPQMSSMDAVALSNTGRPAAMVGNFFTTILIFCPPVGTPTCNPITPGCLTPELFFGDQGIDRQQVVVPPFEAPKE